MLDRSNARIGHGRRLAGISFNLWLARRSAWGFTQRIGRRALRKVNEPFHDHFVKLMERKCHDGIVCGEYVIMPDHIHLFLRIDPNRYVVGKTVGFLKQSLSKPLRALDIAQPHWQPGFFDHILRSANSYSEKWDYVRNNPVRAGLVKCADDWKYQGTIRVVSY